MDKKEILKKLLSKAKFQGGILWSNGTAQDYVRIGRKIPPKYMPGAMVSELSDEERKILETCTEDDFKIIDWRPDDYKNYREEMERKNVKQRNG